MATRIKQSTAQTQLDYIDSIYAELTGKDLRTIAQKAIDLRTAKRQLGLVIASAIGFDMSDGSVVLMSDKKIIH